MMLIIGLVFFVARIRNAIGATVSTVSGTVSLQGEDTKTILHCAPEVDVALFELEPFDSGLEKARLFGAESLTLPPKEGVQVVKAEPMSVQNTGKLFSAIDCLNTAWHFHFDNVTSGDYAAVAFDPASEKSRWLDFRPPRRQDFTTRLVVLR